MAPLALALALAAAGPSLGADVKPAPARLYGVAWQRPFVPPRALETKPIERGGVAVDPATGLAVAGTRDGWLHAVRPDGTIAWEFRAGAPFGPPAIEGDTVYVGSTDGHLYALAVGDGRARWSYDAREDLATRPAISDGTVLVASLQDTVFALDAATGAWRWHHRREQGGEGFTILGAAAVVAGGGTAYAGYSDGSVAALDVATGATRWERRVAPPGKHRDVDALLLDGPRLYAAAYSGAVLALDPQTGDVLWRFDVPGPARLAMAAGLVVAVTMKSIVALSPADGGAIWEVPLGGSPGGSPAVAGRWLLVPAGSGGLRWIEASTGRLLRVFDPGTGVTGPPAVSGARIYALSNGGRLFALDLG